MGCLRLTYDCEPNLFLREQGEKFDAPELSVWVNPNATFEGVGEVVQTGGGPGDPIIPLGMWVDPSSLKLRKIGDAWYGSAHIDEEIAVLKLPNGVARVHLNATVNFNFSARFGFGKKEVAQYFAATAMDKARVALSEELYANPAMSGTVAARDFKEYFGVYLTYLTFGSEVKSYAFPGVRTYDVRFQLIPSFHPGD